MDRVRGSGSVYRKRKKSQTNKKTKERKKERKNSGNINKPIKRF